MAPRGFPFTTTFQNHTWLDCNDPSRIMWRPIWKKWPHVSQLEIWNFYETWVWFEGKRRKAWVGTMTLWDVLLKLNCTFFQLYLSMVLIIYFPFNNRENALGTANSFADQIIPCSECHYEASVTEPGATFQKKRGSLASKSIALHQNSAPVFRAILQVALDQLSASPFLACSSQE